MFERIGLFVKANEPRIQAELETLMAFLQANGHTVCMDANCASLIGGAGAGVKDWPDIGRDCDLVIAIGGDGTMLSAARLVASYDVPLLGINLGHLGFLADILPNEISTTLADILAGHFIEERRYLLRSEVVRDGQVIQTDEAVNDVVIQKWNIARLISFDTFVNGILLHSQRSDGMIVATPTGSTAYALSGGGPILDPSLDAMALVPICPHTLSNRPIVIAGNSHLEMVVGTGEVDHARLTCDGELMAKLSHGDRVRVRKHQHHYRLIHPANHDHYAVLRAKLHWG